MKEKVAIWLNTIYGARKFLLMLVLYTVAVAFRCRNLIDGTQFVDLLKDSTLAFMAANGVEHTVSAFQSYFNRKASTELLVPPELIEPEKKV